MSAFDKYPTGPETVVVLPPTVSLAAAAPFSLIMVCACFAFWKALTSDEREGKL